MIRPFRKSPLFFPLKSCICILPLPTFPLSQKLVPTFHLLNVQCSKLSTHRYPKLNAQRSSTSPICQHRAILSLPTFYLLNVQCSKLSTHRSPKLNAQRSSTSPTCQHRAARKIIPAYYLRLGNYQFTNRAAQQYFHNGATHQRCEYRRLKSWYQQFIYSVHFTKFFPLSLL